MKAFLLIGQSNMSGRGVIGELPDISTAHVSVWRKDHWEQAVEPVVRDKDIAGEGMSIAFGTAVYMMTGEQVGVIPCSLGGSRLDQWLPGEALFETAVQSTAAALQSGAQLCGVLWHQGESDSTSAAQAATYLKRLRPMMRLLEERIRTAAQEMGMPNAVCDPLPVIVAELGDYLDDNASSIYHRQINEQLHAFAALDPAYACVTAHDLPDRGDCLHFDVRAQRRLGLRYACAWMDVTQRLQSKKTWRPALNPEQV